MAYIGRGGFSSFGGNDFNNDNRHNDRRYYRRWLYRRYYYIPLDNTYILFQMIAVIIIFTIAGITILATYKPSVIDPIENTKKMIMNTYIIITLTLVIFTLLSNFFSKNKNTLIKKLIAILVASIVTILVFLGIKINLNTTYTENKFMQIYVQENGEKNTDVKSKLDIGLTGMQMKTEKEYYIAECVKAYNIFTIRMYGIFGVNVLLIVLLIYQISKVSKIQEKKNRLSKDDAILFDEEENIKF